MFFKTKNMIYRKSVYSGTRLDVFDFDKTLFKNPKFSEEPPIEFFDSLASVSPPCIPETPDISWWIAATMKQAKASIKDSNIYTLFVTARQEDPFRSRVMELLQQQGLVFDEHHFRPSSGLDTVPWKALVLDRAIAKFPSVQVVKVWEDTQEIMDKYNKVCRKYGVEIEENLVRAEPHLAECDDAVEQI